MNTDKRQRCGLVWLRILLSLRVVVIASVSLTSGACGSSSKGPAVVPVSGVVTLDGKPLAGAQVTLIPQGATAGQAAMGRTDAAGVFEVVTVDRQEKGAAEGSYRVLISKKVNPDGTDFMPKPDDDPMLASYKEMLPEVYWDETKSMLSAEVPAGGAKLEFKLDSKKR
jgi:hypothetical protein